MAVRALVDLAGQVSMLGAYGVCRAERVVRKLIVLRDRAHELRGALPVRHLLSKEGMEDSSGCIERLELVLHVEGLEDIIGIADRKMGGVRVVRAVLIAGSGDDIRELLDIMLCQAV